MITLRDLGARVGEAKTAEEACVIAAQALAAHAEDIPFALFYLVSEDGGHAYLAGATGVKAGDEISPVKISLTGAQPVGWPLFKAKQSEAFKVIDDLAERFAIVPQGPWSDSPNTAAVVPIPSNKAHEPAGFVVLGVSARLKFDTYYRDFFDLVRTQVAIAIANARAYEEERRRAEALAEIDRVKTAFFSNVSHEFRTPLTLMLGPVEALLAKSDSLPVEDRQQLVIAHRNSLRLLKLVNSLLDFSRIEAGCVRASYVAVDLAALTADLASNFRSAMEGRGP